MNNLDQIKKLMHIGLTSVAVKMMVKDIYEILESTPIKSTNTRKGKIKLTLNKKIHEVIDVVSTGITTRIIPSRSSGSNKSSDNHIFHKFEDLNPLQLWLLAYIYIPKLAKIGENHESI